MRTPLYKHSLTQKYAYRMLDCSIISDRILIFSKAAAEILSVIANPLLHNAATNKLNFFALKAHDACKMAMKNEMINNKGLELT